MPNPTTAAEWRKFCQDGYHLAPTNLGSVCSDCMDTYARQQVEEDRLSRKDYLRGPCPIHDLNFSLCHDCHDLLVRQQVEAAQRADADLLDDLARDIKEDGTREQRALMKGAIAAYKSGAAAIRALP